MAVKIVCLVGKTIGLPHYSSYKFNLSTESEVPNLDDAPSEAERVYNTLLASVDEQMAANAGWLPESGSQPTNHGRNGNGRNGADEHWNCSPKQRDLLLKLV